MADNEKKSLKRTRNRADAKPPISPAVRRAPPVMESPSPAVMRKTRRRVEPPTHKVESPQASGEFNLTPNDSIGSWAECVESDLSAKNCATVPRVNRKQNVPNRKVDTRPKFLRTLEFGDFIPQSLNAEKSPDRKNGTAKTGTGNSQTDTDGGDAAFRRSPRKRVAVDYTNSGQGSPSKRVRNTSIASAKGLSYDEVKASTLKTPERVGRGAPSRPSTPNSACSRPASVASSARSSKSVAPPIKYPLPENWRDPTWGWVSESHVLERRDKELGKAYDSPVYRRYTKEVPKSLRAKGVHPRTPNKYINYPRRSWDQQVRQWKKSLHIWAGETDSNCPSSLNTSFSSTSEQNEENKDLPKSASSSAKTSPAKETKKQPEDPNALASLLGHYDIDSRRGFQLDNEETLMNQLRQHDPAAEHSQSTLKAMQVEKASGPTDFSAVVS